MFQMNLKTWKLFANNVYFFYMFYYGLIFIILNIRIYCSN